MSLLADVIKKTMGNKGIKQPDLVRLTNYEVSQPVLSQILAKRGIPWKPDKIDAIAAALGMDKKNMRIYAVKDHISRVISIFGLKHEDIFGKEILCEGESVVLVVSSNDLSEISDKGVVRKAIRKLKLPFSYGPNTYGIFAETDLPPRIDAGEIIIVAPDKEIKKEDFVVVRWANKTLIGKVKKDENDQLLLLCDNDLYSIKGKQKVFTHPVVGIFRDIPV